MDVLGGFYRVIHMEIFKYLRTKYFTDWNMKKSLNILILLNL